MTNKIYSIEDLLNIMRRLRKECPWDSSQTHETLKQYLVEEAYEVLDSIDSENRQELASELGDLLLQIVFHSTIAEENDHFNFDNVVKNIAEKLIARHPHVFEKTDEVSAKEVQDNWEHNKVYNENRESILSGIPISAPALLQAQRLQQKASTVGFEWDDVSGVLEKIEEEIRELKSAHTSGRDAEIKMELGDVLFSLVNLSRYLNVNAEEALRQTNIKFRKRFNYIEKQYDNNPGTMKKASLEDLDRHWDDAKNYLKNE